MRPRKKVLLIDAREAEHSAMSFALWTRGFRVVSDGPADATLTYEGDRCTIIGGGINESWLDVRMTTVLDMLRRACARKPGPAKGSMRGDAA